MPHNTYAEIAATAETLLSTLKAKLKEKTDELEDTGDIQKNKSPKPVKWSKWSSAKPLERIRHHR